MSISSGVKSVILAGGFGKRLRNIYERLPKPMIPYGGSCSLIDFSIRNCVVSEIQEIVFLTYYQRKELIHYLMKEWGNHPIKLNYCMYNGVYQKNFDDVFAEVIPPEEKGTADAIIQNQKYIFSQDCKHILLLHSDHVYLFDYRPMLEFHLTQDADITMGYKEIDLEDVRLFGMVKVDQNQNVTHFIEKPSHPEVPTVFSAVCIIKAEKLQYYLEKLAKTKWNYDISKDVIPAMIREGQKVKAYLFQEYWEDVGSYKIYYHSNMKLLSEKPSLDFDLLPKTWDKKCHTEKVSHRESIYNSIVPKNFSCHGAFVENSILYPGVFLGADVNIQNSIVFGPSRIEGRSCLKGAIVTENSIIQSQKIEENWKDM